ncbi:MAG: hypothetical protein FJY77_04455 [Candidatus Altiarchaeales archaeon]|nr:hypothetical protein [Candidatus Altiarchaeales archaeon]
MTREKAFELLRNVARSQGEVPALELLPHLLPNADCALKAGILSPDFARLLASNTNALKLVKTGSPGFSSMATSSQAVALFEKEPKLLDLADKLFYVWHKEDENCAEVMLKQLEDEKKKAYFFDRKLGEKFAGWVSTDQALIPMALEQLESGNFGKIDDIIAHGRGAVRKELAHFAVKKFGLNESLLRATTVPVIGIYVHPRGTYHDYEIWVDSLDDYRLGRKQGGFKAWLEARPQSDTIVNEGHMFTDILTAAYEGTAVLGILFSRESKHIHSKVNEFSEMLEESLTNPAAVGKIEKALHQFDSDSHLTEYEKANIAYGVYSTLKFVGEAGILDEKSSEFKDALGTACNVVISNVTARELNRFTAYTSKEAKMHGENFDRALNKSSLEDNERLLAEIERNSTSSGLRQEYWQSLLKRFSPVVTPKTKTERRRLVVADSIKCQARLDRIRNFVQYVDPKSGVCGNHNALQKEMQEIAGEMASGLKPERFDEYSNYLLGVRNGVMSLILNMQVNAVMLKLGWDAEAMMEDIRRRREYAKCHCSSNEGYFRYCCNDLNISVEDMELATNAVEEYSQSIGVGKEKVYHDLVSHRVSYIPQFVNRMKALSAAGLGAEYKNGAIADLLGRIMNDTTYIHEITTTPHLDFWLRPPARLENSPELYMRFMKIIEMLTPSEERSLMGCIATDSSLDSIVALADQLENPPEGADGCVVSRQELINRFVELDNVRLLIGVTDVLKPEAKRDLFEKIGKTGGEGRKRAVEAARSAVVENFYPNEQCLLVFHDIVDAEVSRPGEAGKAYGFMLPYLKFAARYSKAKREFRDLNPDRTDFYKEAVEIRKDAVKLLEEIDAAGKNSGFTEGRKLRGEHSRNFDLMREDLRLVLVDFLGNVLKFGGVDESGSASRPKAGREYFQAYPEDKVMFQVKWDRSITYNTARREGAGEGQQA